MNKIRIFFMKIMYKIAEIACMVFPFNFILCKKRYGCFGVMRYFGLGRKNKIVMICDKKIISEYRKSKNKGLKFLRDLNRLVKKLDKDIVYNTTTHDVIIRGLEKHKAIEIVSKEEYKVKSLLFEKLLIDNFNNGYDEKVMFYKVKFKVKELTN